MFFLVFWDFEPFWGFLFAIDFPSHNPHCSRNQPTKKQKLRARNQKGKNQKLPKATTSRKKGNKQTKMERYPWILQAKGCSEDYTFQIYPDI